MKLTGERPIEGKTPSGLLALHAAGYREVVNRLGDGRLLDLGCGLGDGTANFIDGRRTAGTATDSDDTDRLPGDVAGLGPVTADTLRDLLDLAEHTGGTVDGAIARDQTCPGADTHRIEGPGPYAPPERLKNLLRVRNRVCVFPGCARPSRRCELDHTRRYPEGPTCSCNLAPLCVHHHHLKHQAPGWTLINHGDGRLTWTAPTGRRIEVGQHETGAGPEPPGPPTAEPPPSPPRPEDIPPY